MTTPEDTARPERRATLVVYTGGTFGMRDLGNGLEATADLEEALTTLVPSPHSAEAAPSWRYLQLERIIDSADADLAHALAVASMIRAHADDASGVVVVHGTDTLAYTAAVAAFALADLAVPVVFTGAQRSMNEPGSDATENFLAAFREAGSGVAGVRIAFGGAVIPAVRAIKRSSDEDEAFAAFRPLAPGPAGAEELGRLRHGFTRLGALAEQPTFPSVGLLRIFPGFSPRLISTAAELYPDGLVLECYGAGTAPMSTPGLSSAVAEAAERGVPVVAITQCDTGSVRLERYALGAELQRAGAWSGYDLTADAAMAKLGVLAAMGLDGASRRIAFETNLVGEQHSRREEALRIDAPALADRGTAHSSSIIGRTTAST